MKKTKKKEKSKYLVAAAGAGKTTYLVTKALESDSNKQILITTYTRENEKEIKRKFIKERKAVPPNITIQTWWSFLLQHGVRPYRNAITETSIKGLLLVNERSGKKPEHTKANPRYYGKKHGDKFYLSPSQKIYSDKLAAFVVESNKATGGAVFDRISNIFDYLYIDETQDLVGYDLEIIKQLTKRKAITLVGDPRQATFETHHTTKHSQYAKGNIEGFINNNMKSLCDVDKTTLNESYRCNQNICDFSSPLFPSLPVVNSKQSKETKHDGVFILSSKDVDQYMNLYSPVQLRYSRDRKVNPSYKAYNYGESKGLTFDRTIIYPTGTIIDHLLGKKKLTGSSLCKFYVALTRARFSTAIVWDTKETPDRCSEYVLF